MIWLIVVGQTPNSRPNNALFLVVARLRISSTCSAVNTARPLFRPLGIVPSLILSSPLFWVWVPNSKWSGLTQRRLRHLCLTTRPAGISPWWCRYETRWARYCLPPILKKPYLSFAPVHNQQSTLSTFVINRASVGSSITFVMNGNNTSVFTTNGVFVGV
jgi:hypothetical protein